jgi:hypothetical protein
MREIKSPYKILVGKPERKGLLERPRRKWEDSIKISGGFNWLRIGYSGGLLLTR